MRTPPPLAALPRYPVSGGLCLLAIGVTIAGAVAGDQHGHFAALTMDPSIARGQLWRLITATLPHANPIHLLFNVLWVWTLGTLIEEVWGTALTALIVLLLGAGSMAAEYAFLFGGIGLSGVVYGFFGLLWALGKHDARFAGAIDRNTATTFVVWFFFCIAATLTHVLPVANIAHGMGAALGCLLGMAIAAPRRRAAWRASLIATAAACLLGATVGRPSANFVQNEGQREAVLGYEASQRGDDALAIWWYRRSVRYPSPQAGTCYNLGLLYARADRHAEAARMFERAARIEPDNADYRALADAAREAK